MSTTADGSGDRAAEEARTAGRHRGPGRRVVVLAGLAAGGALAGTSRSTWLQATGSDLTGSSQSIAIGGGDAAPAVLALALVAVAAAAATSLSSHWVRFVTGPVLVLAGIGAIASILSVVEDPASAAVSGVSEATGVVGGDIGASITPWPWIALVPALLVIVVGAAALVLGGRWPRGSRYRSPAVRVAADPEQDPAAAWDALTRGEDPTDPEPEDPADSAGDADPGVSGRD